jgi:hypothetical protein
MGKRRPIVKAVIPFEGENSLPRGQRWVSPEKLKRGFKKTGKGAEIIRRRNPDIQGETGPFPGDDKPRGIEQEPFEAPGFSQGLVQGKIPVFIIPQDRVADFSQMPTDLVHTAGVQFQFQKGKFPVSPKSPVPGPGRLFRPSDIQAVLNYPGGRGITGADGAVLLDTALAFGLSAPFPGGKGRGPFPRKNGGKPGGGFPVFGNQDDPGGILVKPVYQKGAGRLEAGQKGVQGTAHPGPSLYRQSCRFIEDHTFFVFKKYRNIVCHKL